MHCECEIDEITYKLNFAHIIQLRIIGKIQTSMSSSTKKKGKGGVMNAKQLSQLFVKEKCHSLFFFYLNEYLSFLSSFSSHCCKCNDVGSSTFDGYL